ncbi:MAG: transposase [Sandaracinaceae bacterium]
MPSAARSELVDVSTTPYYHCISRCVRRAFLCGKDPYTGKNFDHRKQWLVDRLHLLSEVFAVDVCAYAVMSNHLHLVVRVDKERAESWDDDEVVARFGRLYRMSMAAYELLDDENKAARVAEWRARLWDLSWMMRSLNEWFARKANKEDACRGRFWEGRFKSQALLDEAAVLTCMTYVDLNLVRAGVCKTLDEAEFTSIYARLREASRRMDAPEPSVEDAAGSTAPSGLVPFVDQAGADDEGSALPMLFADYVQLLEWTGQAVRHGAGWLRGPEPAVMSRMGIEPEAWLKTMSSHGIQSLSALGSAEQLEALARTRDKKWVRGQGWARRMFAAA